MAENTIFQSQDMDPMDQWVQQYWAALYNPVQTQQSNVGQQLAAGPSTQQQQVQTQQVQQQQQAAQQQAPASVPQGQTITQPQSNVGMVQKIDTAPANVPIEGMSPAPAENGSIQYQGELKPVYDEVGQIVQWAPAESPAWKSAFNDQGYDAWGGKRPGDWNLNLPDIQQGGLDQPTIDALGQLENNPNFHGGKFNPEEWEEGPMWIPENFQGANEELGVRQAQGGDPTDTAGQVEQISNVDQYALRNKITGEVVPVSQLFRELPKDAAGINTKIAEYARSHPWWKEDLVPGIIKGISAAIATAAGGAMLGPMLGAGASAAGMGAGAAGTLGTAAGAGTGAALAQNAMMEGDIGDRLLPTALAFGGGAAAPYAGDLVGGFVPESWKEAVSGFMPIPSGDIASSGVDGLVNAEAGMAGAPGVSMPGGEKLAGNILTEGGMIGPNGVAGSPEELSGMLPTGAAETGTLPPEMANRIYGENWNENVNQVTPFDQQQPSWTQRGPGKYQLYPETEQDFINQLADGRYGRTSWEYDLADSNQRSFDELANQDFTESVRRGLTIDPETGQPYLDPEATAVLDEMFPDNPLSNQSIDQWTQDLNNQSWQNRWVENIDARNADQLNVENQDFVDWLYNNSWNGDPLSALDRYKSGFNWKDYIPSASTIAALTSLYKILSTPDVGGGGGGSVHAGGSAEAPIDMSELSGLLARSAGSGGGGQTGPQGGGGRGGGEGEGGMLALMNLILNEMQKGGKYYFQT